MPTSGVLVVISKPVKPDADAEAFVTEVREAHKSRRVYLEGGSVQMVSHEHYLSQGDEHPAKQCLDLYEVDDVDPFLDGKLLLEEGGDGPIISSRSYVYRTLSTHGTTAGHSSDSPADLVIVSIDPPMTILDDFNRWYQEEHIPMLSKVQGYQSTTRGKLALLSSEADQDMPKFAAMYRYGSPNGQGTSDEWKAAVSTEWAKKIMGTVEKDGKKTRSVWTFQDTHH